MTAGSRAPNVYRILAEHNTDTAKAGLASTASFLGSATHNVLDYAYRLYGGVQHSQSVDVIRTYPAVTAAIGVVAYSEMASYLARDPAVTRASLAAARSMPAGSPCRSATPTSRPRRRRASPRSPMRSCSAGPLSPAYRRALHDSCERAHSAMASGRAASRRVPRP